LEEISIAGQEEVGEVVVTVTAAQFEFTGSVSTAAAATAIKGLLLLFSC